MMVGNVGDFVNMFNWIKGLKKILIFCCIGVIVLNYIVLLICIDNVVVGIYYILVCLSFIFNVRLNF